MPPVSSGPRSWLVLRDVFEVLEPRRPHPETASVAAMATENVATRPSLLANIPVSAAPLSSRGVRYAPAILCSKASLAGRPSCLQGPDAVARPHHGSC